MVNDVIDDHAIHLSELSAMGGIVHLYPYQKRWLADNASFKIGMFARQTGKTFISTLEMVLDCFSAEATGKKVKWIMLSRGERQAKEAMDTGVKKHCQAINVMLSFIKGQTLEIRYKADEVIFPNGSSIMVLPANPDTARGFSANVYLDEFAFHADSHKLWASLFPVISAGYKIRVTSTPNGCYNKFHDLMTNDKLSHIWSRHTVDIYQAVFDGLNRDIAWLKSGLNDDSIWQTEYELQWANGSSTWLPSALIESCEDNMAGDPDAYQQGSCFVGVDIGHKRDLFSIWVVEEVGNQLMTREVIAKKGIPFYEQDQLLASVFERYRVARCCMDQTGLGAKPVEDAQRHYGKNRIEGVHFTAANKLLMATMGKQMFETGRIRIPAGNNDIRKDFLSLKKTISVTGAPRFDGDRSDNAHADRTWACFLAIHASDQKPNIQVNSRQRRSSGNLFDGYFVEP